MDNVTELLNMTHLSITRGDPDPDVFALYPDPTFDPFENQIKMFFQEKNDDLLINVSCFIELLFCFIFKASVNFIKKFSLSDKA